MVPWPSQSGAASRPSMKSCLPAVQDPLLAVSIIRRLQLPISITLGCQKARDQCGAAHAHLCTMTTYMLAEQESICRQGAGAPIGDARRPVGPVLEFVVGDADARVEGVDRGAAPRPRRCWTTEHVLLVQRQHLQSIAIDVKRETTLLLGGPVRTGPQCKFCAAKGVLLVQRQSLRCNGDVVKSEAASCAANIDPR